ncbi:dolichyl-P-Man:Man(5)GlcNAc(2)-PP-dolichol alpha-1,3-mannosyltransferase [Orbilia oligospora]|uniref:Dol-P-Man:Man(5)GlcNAc(2)-PP-Dol alpha-1,3-mannosyltransferase n=1 Tax=Orbilia oligospora TaxID=2813651 RepID=A0A8H8V750_ORBOL|nr:dolichyl-P-Man:Man(5)GlcNAc(2)-PP-dolichol alpha-1,3-mannosyltransferase [Orbilia oligospora]
MNLIKWACARGIDIARHPKYGIHVALALLCFDGLLSYVILRKVPYTEIDWEAYMEQISQYRAGERDYRNIKGGTGPLVYPAGHVYIYNWLYTFTDGGVRRERVQVAFWVAYMATLWLTMACYRKASAPPWTMCLLVLSKRLHSIYLLRFFNDCFSTLLVFASILLVQTRQYTLSAVFYSLSVGVKMSSLLYLPALGLIFVLSTGSPGKALRLATLMLQIQVLLAVPFVASESGSLSGYLGRAFEFSRAFLWKWTVNWRFVGEDVFTSFWFKVGLLVLHIALLFFFLSTRWLRPVRGGLIQFIRNLVGGTDREEEIRTSAQTDGAYMLTTLFTCNMVGMLCARSLHYQFYSWMAWTTPFLLWKSGLGVPFVVSVWAMQEYAWNVYPSSRLSSAMAVGCMVLQLMGVWIGASDEKENANAKRKRV